MLTVTKPNQQEEPSSSCSQRACVREPPGPAIQSVTSALAVPAAA
jgi:hypothetical protein